MTSHSKIVTLALLAVLATTAFAASAEEESPKAVRSIALLSRELPEPADRAEALRPVADIPPSAERHLIVRLREIPTKAGRTALRSAGLRLLEPVADRAWFAAVRGDVLADEALLRKIDATWTIEPADRLAPKLREAPRPEVARDGEGRLRLRVLAFPGVDLEVLASDIAALGGTIDATSNPFDTLTVRLPETSLLALAGHDGIHWIEPGARAARPELNHLLPDLGADVVQQPPYDLSGLGVTVGVLENGHAVQHPDLAGRLTQGDAPEAPENDNHATAIAGIVAGDGNHSGGLLTGLAPDATVLSFAYGFDDATWETRRDADLVASLQAGIDVANNSWGYEGCNDLPYGDYTAVARQYDFQVLGQDSSGNPIGQPTVVVFSGGNERWGYGWDAANETTWKDCIGDDTFPYRNYGTVNQPKTAKNVIVVGAVESNNPLYMTEYSSWGPTSDGRLRPDIVAGGQHQGSHAATGWSVIQECDAPWPSECKYGWFVDQLDDSTRQLYRAPGDPAVVGGFDDYAWIGATSAAAAQVSGAAALFLEDYRTDHGGSNPQPSLVKAHFIHTARDLDLSFSVDNGTRPGPDYATGYGFLDLDAAMDQYRTGAWATGCVDQGQSETLVLPLPDVPMLELKVTLVWDDAPGSPAASSPALVNDLDLIVTGPSGTRHFPWTLDPADPTRAAWRNSPDHLNNVEVVLAEGIVPGAYTVEVQGSSVQAGPQCYSLVYDNFAVIDADGDGWEVGQDCDDTDPDSYPGAMEACSDGRDNDCDGEVDEWPCVDLHSLVDQGDGTVYDLRTCLIWLQDSTMGDARTWAEAAAWAADLVYAGYDDWRLPSGANPDGTVCNSQPAGANCTQTEMGDMYFNRHITLSTPGPFTLGYRAQWTATELPGSQDQKMTQDMEDGGNNPASATGSSHWIWAVRSVDSWFCTPAPGYVVRDDFDQDGFTEVDDCNDANPNVNPLHEEVCGDHLDNDCDGDVDEFCGCGAGLVDLGDGTVLETETCLMWTKDGTWSVGYKSTVTQAVDQMTLGGYTDWRLPLAASPDATCDNPDPGSGYDCRGGELGHLYYDTLGNLPHAAGCEGPFTDYGGPNPTPTEYWSENTSLVFDVLTGYQRVYTGGSPEFCQFHPASCYRRAWPVRDHSTAQRFPGNPEVCDAIDNDCDGFVDDIATTCGLGACAATGFCSDGVDSCVPGTPAPEACDGIDNDCNGLVDDGLDQDGDGYMICAGDCDDEHPGVNPGATEICDGLDNDCNGLVDDGFDQDQDGVASCEDCDDLDPAMGACNTPPSAGPVTVTEGEATVTFPNVTSPGDTTLTVEQCDQTQMDGITPICPNAPCLDVQTTVGFDGRAEVCINFDASGCADACSLRLVACDGSPDTCEFLDIGPNDDRCNGKVCGLTDHFSYFGTGLARDSDADGTPDLADNCPATFNLFQIDADKDGHGDECDCLPGDPTSFPGALELCDGADNDCNGATDDACLAACASPAATDNDVPVSNSGNSYVASVAWTGSEYGIAWYDDRDANYEIYFTRLNADGTHIGQEVRLTQDDGVSGFPSLVWTGSEYGIAWRDNRDGNEEIYFARLNTVGNRIGPVRRVTLADGASGWPSLVWNGEEYGIAWYDERDGSREIYFTRLSPTGNKIRGDIRITDVGFSSQPSLAWTGTEWGISWHDDRHGNTEIYFMRLEADGDPVGASVRVTDALGASEKTALVSNGAIYGVVWHDDRDGAWEIYFARLDPSGAKLGSELRLTSDPAISGWPTLTWGGGEFGVFWHDQRNGAWEIYHAVVDTSGNQVGNGTRLTYEGSGSYQPAVTWDGSAYALGWHDNREGNFEIYFNRVRCCEDGDADGFSVCQGDCNDANGSVYPGASEICDYSDNNCNGMADEGFAVPGLVQGLRIGSDRSTITWDAEPTADRYDAVSGSLSDLHAGDFSGASCLESDSTDTWTSHTGDPAPRQGFYFLVRAERSCRHGSFDSGFPEQAPGRDAAIPESCP